MKNGIALRVLAHYYQTVLPLREYLHHICSEISLQTDNDPAPFIQLLHTTYIASNEPMDASTKAKFKKVDVFCKMYEVIDRAQVQLFEAGKGRPSNVITHGFRLSHVWQEYGRADGTRRGITNYYPNTNLTVLKSSEWVTLLSRIGESAMIHILVNTNVFVPLPNGSYAQIVGQPITSLMPRTSIPFDLSNKNLNDKLRKRTAEELVTPGPSKRRKTENDGSILNTSKSPGGRDKSSRTAADIPFMRRRMFYAQPLIGPDRRTEKRSILVGFPLNHVLNRLAPVGPGKNGETPSREKVLEIDARHVLKHMFPRQFGLESAFTINLGQQPVSGGFLFPDYSNRDEDISKIGNIKTPKRLKPVIELAEKMIQKHWACSYRGIRANAAPSKLKKVMPSERAPLNNSIILEMMAEKSYSQTARLKTQASLNVSITSDSSLVSKYKAAARREKKLKPKFAEFTCSYREVYHYVRKVTTTVIPHAFWGCQRNFNLVMKNVERFIKGRRDETITLHSVLQGFSIQECEWLLPQNPQALNQRPVATDALKRRELVEEFLYWYFDSFVMPLLRTTFYITDSGAFRQRILYFRLDDWTKLCRPLVDQLTDGTFEKIESSEAESILKNHKLGFSFVRLLPKETGVRPIVNLRRKPAKPTGAPALSINQILNPAFQILTYEKNKHPHLIGASVLGRSQIYSKLKDFKTHLLDHYGQIPKLYFVKVDVRACFDSIKQTKLLKILKNVLSEEDGYMIHRSSAVLPIAGKLHRRYLKRAESDNEHPQFITYASKLADMSRHAIFVDQVTYPHHEREEIQKLLKEHVTDNIVKIGQDYYRQTLGIPQGSILSSLLCSYFYGDLERNVYQFTEDQDSTLLRLIDDYLLITCNISKARLFLTMMKQGHPDYGYSISEEKTLTNFDADEYIMNRTAHGQKEFPWCGLLIDMKNLSVSGDHTRYYGDISDSLRVDRGRHSGAVFEHRVLQMANIRSHVLFWDNKLNSSYIVHRNIYHNFLISAMKICAYIRDWKINLDTPSAKFVLRVVRKMIKCTYRTIRSHAKGKLATEHGAVCAVNEVSVDWLGTYAFWLIFQEKTQPGFIAIKNALEDDLERRKYAWVKKRWSKMVKDCSDIIHKILF